MTRDELWMALLAGACVLLAWALAMTVWKVVTLGQ